MSRPGLVLEVGDDTAELDHLVREARYLLIRHPVAAQALFASFVAEGRAYARTEQGARLRRKLRDSVLVRRGRLVWEATTLSLLEEEPASTLPTQFVEALTRAISIERLEPWLAALDEEAADDGG